MYMLYTYILSACHMRREKNKHQSLPACTALWSNFEICFSVCETYKQRDIIIIILSYFRCVFIGSIPLFVSCWLFLANLVL